MSHPLDRPIWNALTTHHAPLSVGGKFARRYADGFTLLAATVDDSAASFAELRELAPAGSVLVLATTRPVDIPEGFEPIARESFDQMVAISISMPSAMPKILPLGETDAPAMLTLASSLLPNSLSGRSHELGRHIGIRNGAELVAMAGERLRLPKFVEINAVCTEPTWRGRGYASALVAALGQAILDRGESPFLHVHNRNQPAIAIYRRLGFARRRVMCVTVLSPMPKS